MFLSFHPTWIDLITGTVFYPMISFMGVFVVIVSGVAFYKGMKSNWEILRPAKFYFPAFGIYLMGALAFSWAKVVGFLLLTFLNTI